MTACPNTILRVAAIACTAASLGIAAPAALAEESWGFVGSHSGGSLQHGPAPTEDPVAVFTWSPHEPLTHETVRLDASESFDADGEIVLYEWDLDDYPGYEHSSAEPMLDVSWPVPGPAGVRLRVHDSDGNTSVALDMVTVRNQAPQARLVATPQHAYRYDKIVLDARGSSDVDGQVVSAEWDLDGNGTFERSTDELRLEHQFATLGTHVVRVRVTDDFGDVSAVAGTTVEIVNALPSATFSYSPVDPLVLQQVRFDASASTDLEGPIVRYEWDLDGDGAFEKGSPMPGTSHTWSQAGTYVVSLRVTDADGATSMTTRTVTVRALL